MLKLVKSEHDKFLIDIQKLHDNVIFFFLRVTCKRYVIVH